MQQICFHVRDATDLPLMTGGFPLPSLAFLILLTSFFITLEETGARHL